MFRRTFVCSRVVCSWCYGPLSRQGCFPDFDAWLLGIAEGVQLRSMDTEFFGAATRGAAKRIWTETGKCSRSRQFFFLPRTWLLYDTRVSDFLCHLCTFNVCATLFVGGKLLFVAHLNVQREALCPRICDLPLPLSPWWAGGNTKVAVCSGTNASDAERGSVHVKEIFWPFCRILFFFRDSLHITLVCVCVCVCILCISI
jgi:hypothetical protein